MIVDSSVKYNSKLLKDNINSLIINILLLKLLPLVTAYLAFLFIVSRFGTGSKSILLLGQHANEWITSTLLMTFLENMCMAYNRNSNIYGYNVKNILTKCTLCIVQCWI